MNNESSDDNTDPPAPGWDAIDAALRPLYGETEPFHWGTLLPYSLGGEDPLHGISAYHRTEPAPHFHYITYGFSDLWGEGEPGGEYSKFGFELTFRLACGAKKAEPPQWPLSLLQNLARYVFKTGNHFQAGEHVNANGPIALDTGTQLCALAFAPDPELGAIETDYGRVEFLQIVGLCSDEYETIKAWRTDSFLELLARQYPLLITDLMRASILADAAIAAEVETRMQLESSLQTAVYAPLLECDVATTIPPTVRIRLGANVVGDLLLMLEHQVARGKACSVMGPAQTLQIELGDGAQCEQDGAVCHLCLPPPLVAEIRQQLRIERGAYRFAAWPDLEIEVIPTEIKDQDGRVIAVIG